MAINENTSTLELLLRFNKAQTLRVQQLARLQTAYEMACTTTQSHAAAIAGYERVCTETTPIFVEASDTIRSVATVLEARPDDIALAQTLRYLQTMEKERFQMVAKMHSYGLQTLAGDRDFTTAEQDCKQQLETIRDNIDTITYELRSAMASQ